MQKEIKHTRRGPGIEPHDPCDREEEWNYQPYLDYLWQKFYDGQGRG